MGKKARAAVVSGVTLVVVSGCVAHSEDTTTTNTFGVKGFA